MFHWWGRMVVLLRWPILIISFGVLMLGGGWGGGVFADLTSGGFDDPASESSRALKEIEKRLGRQGADILALYSSAEHTVDDEVFREAVVDVTQRIKDRPEVASVVAGYAKGAPPALFSSDRHATYLVIQLRDGDENAKLDDLAAIEAELEADNGISTDLGGQTPFLRDANTQIREDITKAEMVTMPILMILLIFIFRGFVAAVMPLVVGILAVLGAFIAVRILAQLTEVSVFSVNIITMLGLGMAIDYALFIVSRFREELTKGQIPVQAVITTITTAGRTVVVSGMTVALALASLLAFPVVFLKSMAWGGMAAVLVAMLAALTALPAILAVLGRRINSLQMPFLRPFNGKHAGDGGWARLARVVMRRPMGFIFVLTALLLLFASPFLRVEFGGFDERVLPEGTGSRTVTQKIANDFPGGSGTAPILVLANRSSALALAGTISEMDGVNGVRITAVGGGSSLIEISYPGEPTSQHARDLVERIRALPPPDLAEFLVGGRTAQDVDLLDALAGRLPLMLSLVAASTLLLLFMAFGSVVLPMKAIVMNVISIGASFGVVVWIFQEGHLADWLGFTVTGFLEPGNLVLMLAILFGLATDYEVFLLSRVREEWDATGDNARAVTSGLQRTGGIITAAALLLIVVLGGFATGGTTTIKMMGVGMVVAIVVDATLVRAVLVPATMRLMGSFNWWAPRALAGFYHRYGIKEG